MTQLAAPAVDVAAAPAGAPALATAVCCRDQADPRSYLSSLVELTKPRITRLVVITAAVGFALGALGRAESGLALWLVLAATLAGTALSAAGASAMNQWWERRRDALMPRTIHRPIPSGRVGAGAALLTGTALCLAGPAVLLLVGPLPALISAFTILSYLLVYTPLKPVTPLATIIGAFPGALPPLIGWTAATALLPAGPPEPWLAPGGLGGWSLVLLMFVWQIPHFMAIAWMYRDDYAAGGFRMLPLADADGSATSSVILMWSIALVPATVAPAFLMPYRLSPVYVTLALATGGAFCLAAAHFARTRTRHSARRLFLTSIIHLPLIMIGMVIDALVQTL
ncbi:MAG TPA: heme o synthase [Phycisphaerales bacterium]|nr:heme o synthase [Phycisphaerales bacterium]